jgi:two-component system nitrate/nitrite response regulator NarL
MGSNLATVVLEPLLVREAVKSLMARNSHQVVCDVGSTEEISTTALSSEATLVILGVQSADGAVAEAVAIRSLWPDSKIILLYEHVSPADFRMLPRSQIDGCIPVSVSPDTLIKTLDMIVAADIRVMIAPDATSLLFRPVRSDERHQSEMKALQSNDAEPRPALSQREAPILDGLANGHANKVIARTCDIAGATVKVHIRSILRKIGVANRTQAAIWALKEWPATSRANCRK